MHHACVPSFHSLTSSLILSSSPPLEPASTICTALHATHRSKRTTTPMGTSGRAGGADAALVSRSVLSRVARAVIASRDSALSEFHTSSNDGPPPERQCSPANTVHVARDQPSQASSYPYSLASHQRLMHAGDDCATARAAAAARAASAHAPPPGCAAPIATDARNALAGAAGDERRWRGWRESH
eukprot:6195735-Pleurochrysis_carterae.AAC.1